MTPRRSLRNDRAGWLLVGVAALALFGVLLVAAFLLFALAFFGLLFLVAFPLFVLGLVVALPLVLVVVFLLAIVWAFDRVARRA